MRPLAILPLARAIVVGEAAILGGQFVFWHVMALGARGALVAPMLAAVVKAASLISPRYF